MRSAAIIVGILMAATPSNAIAETSWVTVGKNDEVIMQVDTSRIKRTGNIVRYWRKSTMKNDKDGWDYTTAIEEVDCVDEKIRFVQVIVYFKSGKIETVQGNGDWVFVSPDTLHESVSNFICSK